MMEAGMFEYNKEEQSVDLDFFQGEKRKIIQPASLKDPKFEDLKQALVDWINDTLKREHIVVQSLEEDMYDGLILHHLLVKLADAQLSVADIALTAAAQMHKLELVLEELDKRLDLQDSSQSKWNVKLIHNKDLLATVHLLVAMVRRFQPELNLPSNVKVEVVTVEVSSSGIKSVVQTEELTGNNSSESLSDSGRGDPIEELLKLEAYKVNTVKKAILHFVNQNMSSLGLQVTDMDKQFSDGVILLLLIGQLEGFFIPLSEFTLTPVSHSEMLDNVTLALDLLCDVGVTLSSVKPQDLVSQNVTATLKILYALFKRHKKTETAL